MKLKSALTHLLMLSLLVSLFPSAPARVQSGQDKESAEDENEEGLRFRLSEGPSAGVESPKREPAAPASPLSAQETERLLARLPNLKPAENDIQNFRLREGSLPPPRAGQTIQAAFAETSSNGPPPPTNTGGPLEVSRFTPQGEVALAPALSITFSQPMTALSSQEEAAANVPVILTPQPKGRWRWLGPQTLIFQPEVEGGRLPMATSYTVTIPAGTESALGNRLAETKTFTFATPPPTLKRAYPTGASQPRDALMFLEFDQRIDPARMLESISLQPAASGTRLRLASAEEMASDESITDLIKEEQEGRWLVLRAVDSTGSTKDALPSATDIKLVIRAGAPSAEGPRLTTNEQHLTFKTYGPLQVTKTECGSDGSCSPFDSFQISFSNNLDFGAAPAEKVAITPQIPDVKITGYGSTLNIAGYKRSNTTYTVTLDSSIKDRFGQTLAGGAQATFKVSTARPNLFGAAEGFIVLDPAVRRTFNVYSINYRQLRVRLYKVVPADLYRFRLYRTSLREQKEKPLPPPGTLVFDKVIEVKSRLDELTETAIELGPALTNGYGQALVQVEPVEAAGGPVNVYASRPYGYVEAWVQATDIGLDAFTDKEGIVAWANSLRDGAPLAGVEMTVIPDGLSGKTGADGLVHLSFKDARGTDDKTEAILVARRGDDVAILAKGSQYYWNNSMAHWRADEKSESLAWYVFDDRKLYRPGEEVNVKGWIRKVNLTPAGDTEIFSSAGQTVNYVLKDSQDNEITRGSTRLNALAGFNLRLKLPETMNLGGANLEFKLAKADDEYSHEFRVEEFRRPEFEITAQSSEAPHFVGSSATATMTATYYTGGGLPNTEVEWRVISWPTNYTPPNRSDYTFGKFYAWWRDERETEETNEKTFKAKTDAEGHHTLRIDFDGVNPPRPSNVVAEARVQDVNRQTLTARTQLLVHPANLYVGLKSARTFVQKGEPFEVAAIVTDIDGKAIADREVRFRLVRLDYVYEKGEWKQKEVDAQEQFIRSGSDAVRARLATKEGGMYRLTARVLDERERPNESELSLWVAGGKLLPEREVKQEKVELIPDRKVYSGGNVAEILVQSPFYPAEGVMTLRRSGMLRTERFTMTENSYTLHVPLEEAMTPNLHVQVDLVGAATRVDDEGRTRADLARRTAYASGEINLEIPPSNRRLTVTATPHDQALEPGAETLVDIEVKDAQGRSVQGTDTAVVVVDESVLSLMNYRLGDPLAAFYPNRDADVADYHLRDRLELATADEVERLARAEDSAGTTIESRQITELPINGRSYGRLAMLSTGTVDVLSTTSSQMTVEISSSEPSVELRKDFNALAVFAASVPTDARGHAQVRVKLPDNLTRYHVMAVSVAGGKLAGMGESVITARKQLMVRPSAPRFLNFGDRAELPVVVQNQTDRPVMASVAVRSSNAELIAGAGRRVNVPANDRVEVRFPVAAFKPGTARFQVVAATDERTDATEISLPIYTPATTEAFATYGVIDEGSIAQPVRAPADAIESFGGLEVTTSSTQLQELTDAVIYLVNYPYECSEQIASRVIAISALKDVLAAFKAKELPSAEALRAAVNSDLKRLEALQNDDGGFDFWRQSGRSFPFVSVHVAHALARARSKGFAVHDWTLEQSESYLSRIAEKIPSDYSPESRRAIEAYALYVRALMKAPDAAAARKLIADAGGVEHLSLESLGWLLPVLAGDAASAAQAEAIRRHLNNRVTETAGAAHFADSYRDGAYTVLQSDRRADGILLDALIGDRPQSELIPKLARGLLGGRTRGRWMNTQENVFILLALDRYFNTYEKTTPNFVARVWLGSGYAGEQAFRGRSGDRQQLSLPMSALAERTASGPVNLTIGKEGAGRLYYRIGTRYAPSNLRLAASDYGFKVERKYEAVDDPADVRRDADGTWRIRAGARIRVRLVVSNPARRFHVALVDPLPAGLEALNPELATTESLPDESTEAGLYRGGNGIYDSYWYWRGTWYEHQNLRDERVEAFTSLLWEGEHIYTYFARATTPGLFVVPPPKAEEMYEPETFGRGQSDLIRVE